MFKAQLGGEQLLAGVAHIARDGSLLVPGQTTGNAQIPRLREANLADPHHPALVAGFRVSMGDCVPNTRRRSSGRCHRKLSTMVRGSCVQLTRPFRTSHTVHGHTYGTTLCPISDPEMRYQRAGLAQGR